MADLAQAVNVNMKLCVTIKICDAVHLQLTLHEAVIPACLSEIVATTIDRRMSPALGLTPQWVFIFFLTFLQNLINKHSEGFHLGARWCSCGAAA